MRTSSESRMQNPDEYSLPAGDGPLRVASLHLPANGREWFAWGEG